MLKKITLKTSHKSQMIQITAEISEQIIRSGVKDGTVTVFTPHTTAAVFMFENVDPNLCRDFLKTMGDIAPQDKKYAHIGENAHAHIKSALTGACITLIIEDAKPILGKWQGIFFADFDGPREREVYLKIVG